MKRSIEVIGLTKTYGTQHALDNVSLEVGSGEVIGLLGPNGAGKSTLMKIISCFIPPSSGEVRVLGYDIFSDAYEVRKRVGYLPENNPLYIDMYVKEYLQFVAGIHRLKDIGKRVDEMVALTGLGREQHKRIGALSKGYRQRVGLAQALIHDPEVLILDEPTSGLDPNQLTEIRNLIRETGRSRTVMLSTHIMQEVEAVCDRVIIIDKGRIVADERTEKLTTLLAGTTLLEIEFSSPVDPEKISRIKGVHSVRDKAKGIMEVQVIQGHDVREEIFNLAVSEGVKVLSMSRVEQKLEEIFQVLTSGS